MNCDGFDFVKLFNANRRDKIWNKEKEFLKGQFHLKLNMLTYLENTYTVDDDAYQYFLNKEFYRLSLGYRGIGKGNGYTSGIRTKASVGLPSSKLTDDHLIGTTEVGYFIHQEFINLDFDVDKMTNDWLYHHLFLWATIKMTRVEHHKDNVIRGREFDIYDKLQLKHYHNVSDLI